MQMNTNTNEIKLPLLAQLYENKSPELTMTYKDRQSKLTLELDIWESNYNLLETKKPIWIGSVHINTYTDFKNNKNELAKPLLINPLTYVIPALTIFTLRRMELPQSMIKSTRYPSSTTIILIKSNGLK